MSVLIFRQEGWTRKLNCKASLQKSAHWGQARGATDMIMDYFIEVQRAGN